MRGLAAVLLFAAVNVLGAPATDRMSMDFEDRTNVREKAAEQEAVLERNGLPIPVRGPSAGGVRLVSPVIQFESGTVMQRGAAVVNDPVHPGNRVLEFHVLEPNVPSTSGGRGKSRVQMNLYGNQRAAEVYLSVRMFLPDGMGALEQYPGTFDWLTVAEWWNDAAWLGRGFPFRITVNVVKTAPSAGEPLRLAVSGEAMRPDRRDFAGATRWLRVDQAGSVPIGRWVRLETYVREGGDDDGRFAMAMTVDGEARRVVFDEHRATVHPLSNERDGFRHLNPVKLYTSGVLTEFLARQGKSLRILWDDLEIQACAATSNSTASECAVRWVRG